MPDHRTGESFAVGGRGWLYVLWKCFRYHKYALYIALYHILFRATSLNILSFIMNGYFVSADVDLYHITLTRQEGYRVVMSDMWNDIHDKCYSYALRKHMYSCWFKQVMLNPERLSRERVAEEFSWVQWDSDTQRLFYLTARVTISFSSPI